ncbi:MAG: UDP-N-acetylmuramoyl-tripeptide--D-alanyl-D-alanine ligase, partial [Pseudomonadales bacterium]|nr:UDP-N-acetylmuramoyl-tripeptide--D-alanyl-D-alanine ligase [Pseudomonadales bacterium]
HYPQNKILVLGDMAELGEDTQASHEYVGAFAKNSGINLLLTCGIDSQLAADAFGENAKHFTDRFELAAYLTHHVSADDVVLIKGSRSAAMEDIIKPLIKEVGK